MPITPHPGNLPVRLQVIRTLKQIFQNDSIGRIQLKKGSYGNSMKMLLYKFTKCNYF